MRRGAGSEIAFATRIKRHKCATKCFERAGWPESGAELDDIQGVGHGKLSPAGIELTDSGSGQHYYIFDEVDSLSKAAQAGLKTTLNSPRAAFILTTNNISQLDKGVKDRCVLVEMNAAKDTDMLPLARRITSDEGVVLNDEQLLAAIAGNSGSFRSVISAVPRLARAINRYLKCQ